jgi:hypothetical protein
MRWMAGVLLLTCHLLAWEAAAEPANATVAPQNTSLGQPGPRVRTGLERVSMRPFVPDDRLEFVLPSAPGERTALAVRLFRARSGLPVGRPTSDHCLIFSCILLSARVSGNTVQTYDRNGQPQHVTAGWLARGESDRTLGDETYLYVWEDPATSAQSRTYIRLPVGDGLDRYFASGSRFLVHVPKVTDELLTRWRDEVDGFSAAESAEQNKSKAPCLPPTFEARLGLPLARFRSVVRVGSLEAVIGGCRAGT